MKNWGIWCVIAVCTLCLGLMIGYAVGQSRHHGDILFSGVPTDVRPTAPTESTTSQTPSLVNINTADVEQLQTLPGIGPVLAQAIVDYRQTNGAFLRPEELAKVEGIGKKRMQTLLKYITTGGETNEDSGRR